LPVQRLISEKSLSTCKFSLAARLTALNKDMEKEFNNLINNHRGIIFKVCHLYGFEKEYKEDLFQEIVLQLWKSFPTFRNESLITTWMYRVALNTAISHFRREHKKPPRQSINGIKFDIPDIANDIEQHERFEAMNRAIDQLSRIEKAIIMLYLEEKSYQEISDIMGISHSNVGVKLNRIKIKLGKIIKSNAHES
jgi:RNA polymerase sigma-70 factor (ECF subfamily)